MIRRAITLAIVGLFTTFHLFAQTRLGLHVTQEELTIWRDRANNGPYKNKGDVQSNSPGDWSRIAANAALFKGTSTDSTKRLADRFNYWKGSGCYPQGSTYEPKIQGELLKDAAFYWLIKQDNSYVSKIKYEILRYVRDSQLDFSNTSRWCYFGDSNPGFAITQWLTRVMFAYDYLRMGGQFTSAEQTLINAWFQKAGAKFSKDIDTYYNKRFVDRINGNYTLTSYTTGAEANTSSNKKYPLFYGGPQAGFFAQGYNNRLGTVSRFIGMAGVLTNDAALQTNAKRFFFEWMRYGVYPNGEIADLSRGLYSTSEPERGLLYVFCLAQAMSDLAEVFARKGDLSLYNYSTEDGYYGSQSPGNPKTLLKVMRASQNYLNNTHKRYASFSSTTNSNLLINGIDPYQNPGEITFDIWFALANRYYKSSEVTNNYLRQASGCRPYPSNPRNTGPNHPWSGQAAIYPGVLFMFGKLEGKVWPYSPGSNSAPTVSLTAPSNGTTFSAGANITITANAADSDGSVTKVDFYQGSTLLGTDNIAPYSVSWNNLPVGTYTLKAVATDNAGATTTSSTINITVNTTTVTTNCTATGTILRELWSKVEGKTISTIPLTKAPTSTSQLTLFETASNSGDLYGQRVRGYICPPTTGSYTFWIASDDEGELWLSTDDQPANKKRIAYIYGGSAAPREWTKFTTQKSATISLQAGKRYYIEALHKENYGGDNLAVGWQLPNGTQERPIPGSRLSPFIPTSVARTESVEVPTFEKGSEKATVVKAYPNPFQDVITLEWESAPMEEVTVSVSDLFNVIQMKREFPADGERKQLEVELAGASLRPGIYFLIVESGRKREVIRMVKQ